MVESITSLIESSLIKVYISACFDSVAVLASTWPNANPCFYPNKLKAKADGLMLILYRGGRGPTSQRLGLLQVGDLHFCHSKVSEG